MSSLWVTIVLLPKVGPQLINIYTYHFGLQTGLRGTAPGKQAIKQAASSNPTYFFTAARLDLHVGIEKSCTATRYEHTCSIGIHDAQFARTLFLLVASSILILDNYKPVRVKVTVLPLAGLPFLACVGCRTATQAADGCRFGMQNAYMSCFPFSRRWHG